MPKLEQITPDEKEIMGKEAVGERSETGKRLLSCSSTKKLKTDVPAQNCKIKVLGRSTK